MFNPQMTSSQMELLPLVCLCLLSWSGTTSADQPVIVEEGSDVILPCSFGINIEKENLEWKKNGQTVLEYEAGILKKLPDDRFSHFKDELKHGNASILIRNTKVADRGDYTCDIPHDSSHEIVHVKLFVGGELKDRTGENIPGAAPKPFVKTVVQTESLALLQCEAHGVPDLEVHWQDSDGNILPAEEPQVTERGGLLYITVKTTVTKTDNFYCVATQKNLSHEISADTHVHFHQAKPQTDHTGWIVAGVLFLLLVAVAVVVGVVLYRHRNSNKCSRQHTESSPDNPVESSALT